MGGLRQSWYSGCGWKRLWEIVDGKDSGMTTGEPEVGVAHGRESSLGYGGCLELVEEVDEKVFGSL